MKRVLFEDGFKYVLGSIDFPAHNKMDIERDAAGGYVDIPCRFYLAEAPHEDLERIARQIDQENYSPDCFYIEAVVGRDGLDCPWVTSNWFLFYVDNDGKSYFMDDSAELLEAWEIVREDYNTWEV